ncbi:uncharacterized protein LOC116166375 [Photinus pyralis]|uniref:uncharacterized protein LOC116166375 n=1 Tax=Photinus pyralis TaxID=7054 RepID=UPI0012677C33|nr:uncharacterized protein LOC116166375 [Photinus pyralis]
MMQKLWQLKLDRNESIPMDFSTKWINYYDDLKSVAELRIHRNVISHLNYTSIELHGFCDASEVAYGCCVYVRTTVDNCNYETRLLCSKSRVAPLKAISLPRLELCSALLLAELQDRVIGSLRKTFVANRVIQIQDFTKGATWQHVSTKHNPADILSPKDLLKPHIWWTGPHFLRSHETTWSEQIPTPNSYCLRFIHNCKPQQQGYKSGPLQLEEVQDATVRILRACQQEAFSAELQSVAKYGQVGTKSNLKTLNPFLHTDRLLRVGERLTNSHLPFEQQHPIVLPSSHQITTMIIYYKNVTSVFW